MSKIIAIHQPNFMPWLGFFDKIAKSDIFIILDNAPYKKNYVVNRNKIKTSQGEKWLTVPVKAHLLQDINKVLTDESQNWRSNHLKTLLVNYKRAQNFDSIFGLVEKEYLKNDTNLAQFNLGLLRLLTEFFKIKTEIVLASDLKAEGQKNELLIDLIKKVQGNHYLSGQGAKDYLDENLFKKNQIKVSWQKFEHPVYKQLWGEFSPKLSALDFVLNNDYKNFFKDLSKPG